MVHIIIRMFGQPGLSKLKFSISPHRASDAQEIDVNKSHTATHSRRPDIKSWLVEIGGNLSLEKKTQKFLKYDINQPSVNSLDNMRHTFQVCCALDGDSKQNTTEIPLCLRILKFILLDFLDGFVESNEFAMNYLRFSALG